MIYKVRLLTIISVHKCLDISKAQFLIRKQMQKYDKFTVTMHLPSQPSLCGTF